MLNTSGPGTIATDATIAVTDVTTNNASTSAHGFLKKLDNTATNFMNGQGNWAAAGGGFTSQFRAALNGNKSISFGTNKVPFDVELFDTGAEYDPTTNYRFTATSTGYYFLSASATVTSAGSGAYGIRLKLNGTTYFDGCNGPTIAQTKTYTVSGVYSLTAGDYVEIWFYVNEASGTQTCYDAYAGTHDGSGFSGFRVA